MTWIEGPEAAAAHLAEAPRHRRLYDYWDQRRGGRRTPARADIDPLDLPELLANLWLIDVETEPMDFRIRLAGTAISRIVGRDITGARFRELFLGPEGAAIFEEYCGVVARWTPHYTVHTVHWANREHVRYRRLALPLSSDGARVDMLLGLAEEAPLGTGDGAPAP
ncbi:MAG: PAS domain-containing protein [Alphaproteobacteria bacterium]|nr:PAS domain-containing protein [Alphaproteobacteria bacterium]